VTALLFFACGKLTAVLHPRESLYQRVLHTLVLCWALVVAAAVALGAVNQLTGPLLLVAVALTALGLLAAIGILPRSAGQDLRSGARSPGGPPRMAGGGLAELSEAALWLFLCAFWAYHVWRGGLLEFQEDFDSLMYHLPLIDHWLQAQSLYAPDAWHWSMPGNNELLGLWCAAPFSGDFLVPLGNVPAVLVLALASRELALLLGLGRLPASVCAAAVTGNRVVLTQLIDVENDVAVAALAVAAVAYGLRYARASRRADLLLAGMALGLLAGVKYYAVGYAAVAGFVLFAASVPCRGLLAAARTSVLAAALAACWGGYWYLRNWVQAGSPLFPKGLFGAYDELSQYYADLDKTSFLGNGNPERFPLALEAIWKMAGPLHLAAFCCLPTSAGWLAVSGVLRRRDPARRCQAVARALLAGAVVAAGLVLMATPFAVEDVPGTLNHLRWAYTPVRYGMTFLSLAVIGFGLLLFDVGAAAAFALSRSCEGGRNLLTACPVSTRARRPAASVAAWCSTAAPYLVLVGLSAYQVVFGLRFKSRLIDYAAFATIAAPTGMGLALLCRHLAWRRLALATVAGAACIIGTAATAGELSERWHAGFASFYDRLFHPGVFTALAAPDRPRETICVLDFRPYPFFGSRRQHHVCQPRRPYSASEFCEYVCVHHVTLVAARFDFDLRARGWEDCQSYLEETYSVFTPVETPSWPYAIFRVGTAFRREGE
jgi:hypothetical protein